MIDAPNPSGTSGFLSVLMTVLMPWRAARQLDAAVQTATKASEELAGTLADMKKFEKTMERR